MPQDSPTKPTRPWDILDAESSLAFDRFCSYRELGPNRSIARAVKHLGKAPVYIRQLEIWSSKHDWVSRARSYDAHVRRESEPGTLDAIRQMRVDHVLAAIRFQTKALDALDAIKPEEMTPGEAIKFFEAAARLRERSNNLADQVVDFRPQFYIPGRRSGPEGEDE